MLEALVGVLSAGGKGVREEGGSARGGREGREDGRRCYTISGTAALDVGCAHQGLPSAQGLPAQLGNRKTESQDY